MKSVTDFQNVLRAIQDNSGIAQMMDDIKRRDEQMRAIVKSAEELRRIEAGFDAVSGWQRDMDEAGKVFENYKRFHLPEIAETARLMEQLRTGVVSETLEKYALRASSLQRAMENMRTPWLDAQNAIRSMTALAELQGIGQLVKNMPGFAETPAATLRLSLGDWRDRITWPSEIFTDLTARANFYSGLGFDHALTDFPPAAFEQSLDIAGLREEPPPLVQLYGSPVPRSEDQDAEEGLKRTNTAHDWLQRLENHMHAFIDQQMTKAFDEDWPKHRLPNGLYEKWQNKKKKAEQAGRNAERLIAYADFTDYELIICRGDNWRQVFSVFFGREENVRESLQRLHPIRVDTMHARPITKDDELLLFVETRRLIKVILAC